MKILSITEGRRSLGACLKRALRGEDQLSCWEDKFGAGDPEEMAELVIRCVLSEETAALARSVMQEWLRSGRVKVSHPVGR